MRVLVVEDDVNLAAVVSRGLRKHAYAVDMAADGEEGLYLARTNNYDLLILDVMLPIKDGFEICRELRVGGAQLPILMLTARDAVTDRVTGLDVGADDYLVKPFDFAELLARVRALLRRRSARIEEKITVGDLILDRATRTAKRAAHEIELTAKEYSLLEYLMENAGRVVTREQIAEHVWDQNFDPFSNVIDVYIKRLRRKVDTENAVELIQTRRGAGYLLMSTNNEDR